MLRQSYSVIGIFTDSKLHQSGIDIPVSGPVRYRWSQTSPGLTFILPRKLCRSGLGCSHSICPATLLSCSGV